jgi:DeoR/GlpR family transcriptional regulator of sugar metabolism
MNAPKEPLRPAPAASRMSKDERQRRIVATLQNFPALRASGLSADLGVSSETIRRDLIELDGKGLINRTYGGAARPLGYEPPVKERMGIRIAERERIARTVAGLIAENEVVFIGSGATTNHIARAIAEQCQRITVITHDFLVVHTLSANPTIRVYFLPGRVNREEDCAVGAQTIAAIDGYQANWAILGSSGIGTLGIYEADDENAAIYQRMAMRAAKTVIAVDSGKFNQPVFCIYAQWNMVDVLCVECMPDEALERVVTAAGVDILVADGAGETATAEEGLAGAA